MKKIYFAPEMKCVKVEISQMVCTSNPQATLSVNEDDKIETPSGFGSRRGSIWGDDEE